MANEINTSGNEACRFKRYHCLHVDQDAFDSNSGQPRPQTLEMYYINVYAP